MVAPAPPLRDAWHPAHHRGSAFQEAAAREVTRLHEARESPWWVEAVGSPVSVVGGFEVIDVVLRSAGAAMALQCLRMTPSPTLRFQRRGGRPAAGNLFTVAHEVQHTVRGETQIRECPALHDAARRALRGAAGLTRSSDGRTRIASPRRPSPVVVPAVLTMARLVPEPSGHTPGAAGHGLPMGREAPGDRFWVWLLTSAPTLPPRQIERRPVAIVTWTGLHHFLSVAGDERQAGLVSPLAPD